MILRIEVVIRIPLFYTPLLCQHCSTPNDSTTHVMVRYKFQVYSVKVPFLVKPLHKRLSESHLYFRIYIYIELMYKQVNLRRIYKKF